MNNNSESPGFSTRSTLQLKDYVFKNLSLSIHIENFEKYDSLPAIMSFDVKTRLLDKADEVDSGEVTLIAQINDEQDLPQAPFNITVVMLGLFKTETKIPKRQMINLLDAEAVRFMFPFLRAAIAELGRMSNERRLPMLILPIMNFENMA